jgi:hypothetical protein
MGLAAWLSVHSRQASAPSGKVSSTHIWLLLSFRLQCQRATNQTYYHTASTTASAPPAAAACASPSHSKTPQTSSSVTDMDTGAHMTEEYHAMNLSGAVPTHLFLQTPEVLTCQRVRNTRRPSRPLKKYSTLAHTKDRLLLQRGSLISRPEAPRSLFC